MAVCSGSFVHVFQFEFLSAYSLTWSVVIFDFWQDIFLSANGLNPLFLNASSRLCLHTSICVTFGFFYKINFIWLICNAGSECNYSMLTFDGVDIMGDRLAAEVSLLFSYLTIYVFSLIVILLTQTSFSLSDFGLG